MEIREAALRAQFLIDQEVAKQNKMWGIDNVRADWSDGQLLQAALAQGFAVHNSGCDTARTRAEVFAEAGEVIYPKDWSGFRDYGSDIANLVVMAAYLQNEIKRRLANDESDSRAPRTPDQPYKAETGLPNA